MQAAQVRKVPYVPDDITEFHPDRDSSSTVFAGTTVQQVQQIVHGCLANLHMRDPKSL